MSASLIRVVRNFLRVGPGGYWRQLNGMGDTKAGTLVGKDRYGNEFYENNTEDEIHLRTRWVLPKDHYYDISTVEPGWHYWLGYGTDVLPTQLEGAAKSTPATPPVEVYHNLTGTTGAYMCYSTVRPKYTSWVPKAAERS